MDGKSILQKHVVVEGHRDVYEQLYRTSIGEKSPIREAIAPRLIRDGINVCVYAVSGDSYSHSQNTGRYLETALDQIDQFLEDSSVFGYYYLANLHAASYLCASHSI